MSNRELPLAALRQTLEHMPADWLVLTTHRLDVYQESRAKTAFLDAFQALIQAEQLDTDSLAQLPTAYDYIRLGHPLSCLLEWGLMVQRGADASHCISFTSTTMPFLAVLRQNKLLGKATRLLHAGTLPVQLDPHTLRRVYGYVFELEQLAAGQEPNPFDGITVWYEECEKMRPFQKRAGCEIQLMQVQGLGTLLWLAEEEVKDYVAEIQHVRRRETIAMTPHLCWIALRQLGGEAAAVLPDPAQRQRYLPDLQQQVQWITQTSGKPLFASSGLSMQYALMMGLVAHAQEQHPDKKVSFVVPPNCYGGTNDQARRVAAILPQVEIVDFPVDGKHDMVRSLQAILAKLAEEDSVPYVIAEIPTNPRVEVPDLAALAACLSQQRQTASGQPATPALLVLDQTFCPNVPFLAPDSVLYAVPLIAYVSGSKFPSGGKCTAAYAAANPAASSFMPVIGQHLRLCDNEATMEQLALLQEQLPSMLARIQKAYQHTAAFIGHIRRLLPEAGIHFVPIDLVERGFTPSVFSLDLPTRGQTPQEREAYKRELNLRLIHKMIKALPDQSKYCVSYGQLKGCYWTIPATSTQGTTKEEDKDYIARVAVAPDFDLERHVEVFEAFVEELRAEGVVSA
ncbi:MAG: cystathionine beta-synthase [Nitritalea sp.]